MLENLSRMLDRDIYINTKSPPEHYSNSKIPFEEIGEEIKPLNDNEYDIIVFVDNLGSSKSKCIDQFFIRGRQNTLDVHYLSQSYSDLPQTKMPNNSNKINLLNQTIKDMEKLYRNIGGYHMIYDELEQLCRKTWEEDYIYLCIERSKNRDHGRYCICIESEITYIECPPQNEGLLITIDFVFN